MEEESVETFASSSDDEDNFKLTNPFKKSYVKSSDEEVEACEITRKHSENGLSPQRDSGVGDSPFKNSIKLNQKYDRVKRFDTSDSESEEYNSTFGKTVELNDKISEKENETPIVDLPSVQETHLDVFIHRSDGSDSEGSCENSSSPKKKSSYGTMFNDDIYDAEGSSEEDIPKKESSGFVNDTTSSPMTSKKKTKKEKRDGRSSETVKKPKEISSEVDEIHKETQRMIRESRVSLPYHVPRQRSLQDFLNRRKSVPKIPLKSNSEDLSIVWKEIEEREKTAETFYNSQTDESDVEKDNIGVLTSKKEISTDGITVDNSKITVNTSDPVIPEELSVTSAVSNSKPDINYYEEKTGLDSKVGPRSVINSQSANDSGIFSNEISTNSGAICGNSFKSSVETNSFNEDINKVLPSNESDNFKNDLIEENSSLDNDFTFFGMSLEDEDTNDTDKLVKKCGNDSDLLNLKNSTNDSIGHPTPIFTSENLSKSLIDNLEKSLSNSNNEEIIKISQDETNIKHPEDKAVPIVNCNSLFNDNLLEKVPKLHYGPGDEIDLDQPIGGTNNLLKRFMKHAKWKTSAPKEKKEVKLRVLSVESSNKGEVTSLIEEELTISSNQETVPGQRLCALKQSLKKSIDHTRSQLLAKRIEQYKLYEKENCDETGGEQKQFDEDEEFENELFGIKDPDDAEETTNLSGEHTNDEDNDSDDDDDIIGSELDEEDFEEKSEKKKSDFFDEEAEESEDDKRSDAFNSDDERLSDAYSFSQDSPAEINKAKKTLEFDEAKASQESTFKKLDLSGLGLDEDSGGESDLLGICSGKFQTQPVSLTQLEADSSQSYDPCTPGIENKENPYSQEMFSQRSLKPNKIIDSDDEASENIQSAKISINNKRLHFSDDEDEVHTNSQKTDNHSDMNKNHLKDEKEESATDNISSDEAEERNENEHSSDDESDIQDEGGAEEEAKVVYYDSEEEIVEGKKFIDVEAELSGSEWGSEDEDEKGLSDFEADEADMEKINQKKLRTELERIHMQEIMAKDKREIKLLQELLLEDGELHSDGPKRQRLYRWSNQDDVDNAAGKVALSDDESGAVADEEEDLQWRKQRLEREQFLNLTRKDEETEVLDETVSMPVCDKKILKHAAPKLQSSLLSSPDPKKPFKLLTNRGSFLGRSEKVLTKLASLAAPTDQHQQRVNRNMVFSVVSPPKAQEDPDTEWDKRKAEEALPRITKKLKFNQLTAKSSRGIGLLQKLMEHDEAT